MKGLRTGLGILLCAAATGCSSAYYNSGGFAYDDLYEIHNKTEIAKREKAEAEAQKAEAEARRAQWEALIAQAQADDAEDFASFNRKRDIIEGVKHASFRSGIALRDVLKFNHEKISRSFK